MAVDALFLDDPTVEALGEQTGAAGPLSLIFLMGQAKVQNSGGEATVSFRRLEQAVYLNDRGEARTILSTAKKLSLIESIEESEHGLTVKFAEEVWNRWQRAARNQEYQDGLRRSKTGQDKVALQDNTKQDRTRKKPSLTGSQRKKAELPRDFPSSLRQFVDPVRTILLRIAESRPGAVDPSMAGVGRALADFPGKDFVPVAADYEHWLLHGTGQSTAVKDVIRGYRNQLRRQPDVTRKTTTLGRDQRAPLPGEEAA